MTDIRIPKFNSNDSEYVLVEWAVADGSPVRTDEVIATVETSKTAEELVSEQAGVLRHMVPVGEHCAPGDVIGRVVAGDSPEAGGPVAAPGATPGAVAVSAPGPEPDRGPVVTEPAKKLIEQLGVSEAALRGLGVKVVREADVRRLAATATASRSPEDGISDGGASDGGASRVASARPQQTADVRSLTPSQRAVAETVTASHDTIPAAYTAIKVDVAAALQEARRQAEALRRLVGLPELLVAAVSSLHSSFPLFFASWIGDGTVRLAGEPCVGVTFDVGKGLVVPVVKNSARLTLAEIADTLGGYRRAAISGTLRQRDLSGGNITLTLHNEPDVNIAVPIVFPGQACALALAGTQPEVSLEPDGRVVVHTVANIGLAYDHRLINGREAIQFLRAVKNAMESPKALTETDSSVR